MSIDVATKIYPSEKDRGCTLVSLALLLRIGVIAYSLIHFGQAWFFSRGIEMGLLADSVVHGRGLSSPFGPFTGPTAMVAPGYPLLVSVVFRGFGSYSWASAVCLMLLHAVCNSATVFLIYRLGQCIASEQSAFLVALFWACSLPLLWMPTIFWETSLSALLLLALVQMALRLWAKPSMFLTAVFGALCGTAGLINPALVPSGLSLAVCLWLMKPRSKNRRFGTAIVFVSFVFVFSPWPLRNYRALHTLVLTRTTPGLELWMGNHPGGEGYLEPSLFPMFNAVELARYRQLGEVDYMNEKRHIAASNILSHPGPFVSLSFRRCFRFWTGSGSRPASPIFFFHGTISLLLGLGGLAVLFHDEKRSVATVMLVPLLLFPLPYYVTHAEFKYRLILDPVLVALGAAALDRVKFCFGKTIKLESPKE